MAKQLPGIIYGVRNPQVVEGIALIDHEISMIPKITKLTSYKGTNRFGGGVTESGRLCRPGRAQGQHGLTGQLEGTPTKYATAGLGGRWQIGHESTLAV
ncbi:hypothetical protein HPP92_004289, partial [Vanilla planifolia]